MSASTEFGAASEGYRGESYVYESPFTADFYSPQESEAGASPVPTSGLVAESPFRAEFFGETESAGHEDQAVEESLSLLYDAEFGEALSELTSEAAALSARQQDELGESSNAALIGERCLSEWLAPLQHRAETLLQAMADAGGSTSPASLSEDEVDKFFENFSPERLKDSQHETGLAFGTVSAMSSPAAEQFLGGLVKKVAGVVKTAGNLARKGLQVVGSVLPIGPLLEKLKGLVRPLLDRVLKAALDQIPPSLRPAARSLATRLAGSLAGESGDSAFLETGSAFQLANPPIHAETVLTDGRGGESLYEGLDTTDAEWNESGFQVLLPTTPEVSQLAGDFDAVVTRLLLAADENEQELLTEEAAASINVAGRTLTELGEARAGFITRIGDLPRGGDPAPALEQFIPAIMAALPLIRTGIGLIGRGRVVDFLANQLAALIRPIVGPDTDRLSKAIADAGLKLLTLEAGHSSGPSAAGPAAIGAVVEDTVRAVAMMPQSELEDPSALAAATQLFFMESMSQHVPTSLLKPRPGHTPETSDGAGQWVSMPQPPRRAGYRKFTRIFDVVVTEQTAKAVYGFGRVSLFNSLRDSRGEVRYPLRARVHLYEAIPGTWLSRIALLERKVPGLGKTMAWPQIRPLTVEAAGMLLGQPGLGRPTPGKFLQTGHKIGVGQRFFYLEFAAPLQQPRPLCVRSSDVFVTADLRQGREQVRIALYLSEADSAAVAKSIVAGEPLQGLMQFKAGIENGIRRVFTDGVGSHFDVLREASAAPAGESFLPVAGLGKWVLEKAGSALISWIVKEVLDRVWEALRGWAKRRQDDFIGAVRDPACGVTIVLGFGGSPIIGAVRILIAGRVPTYSEWQSLVRTSSVLPELVVVPGVNRARLGMPNPAGTNRNLEN